MILIEKRIVEGENR